MAMNKPQSTNKDPWNKEEKISTIKDNVQQERHNDEKMKRGKKR